MKGSENADHETICHPEKLEFWCQSGAKWVPKIYQNHGFFVNYDEAVLGMICWKRPIDKEKD